MADDFTDPRLTVRLDALNRDIRTIESYSLESAYLTSTDGFEFTAYDPDPLQLRNLELNPVTLSIDDVPQLKGRIDVSRVGDRGTAYSLRGRDFLADAVEDNVDPGLVLKKSQTLAEALQFALSPVGIDSVVSDSAAPLRNVRSGRSVAGGPSADFTALKIEDLKPDPGQGLFEFCNRLAARHGATLQAGAERGSVALSAPDYDQEPITELQRSLKNQAESNIKRGVAVRDFSSFPTHTLFTGKGGRAGKTKSRISFEVNTDDLVQQLGGELQQLLDGKMHLGRIKPGVVPPGLTQQVLYRLLYQVDSDAKSQAQIEKSAARATAERLKETLIYTCTVRGHGDPRTGALYAVNTICQVNDEVTNVHEPMWIASRTFTFSKQGGAETMMEMWRPGTFIL